MVINDELSELLFKKIGQFVQDNTGIRMPPQKRTMLSGRLAKRMRQLGLSTYQEYYDFAFSQQGREQELVHLVNVVTTNKTDFFREAEHFKLLTTKVIPELKTRFRGSFDLWSAPCSRGHEPYTLAMVLADYCKQHRDFDYRILGTDLSSIVLEIAAQATYPHEQIKPVPIQMRQSYLLRNNSDETSEKDLVKICKEIRMRMKFQQMNFMDATYNVGQFHVVFCRNMLIYFEKNIQQQVIQKISKNLVPGGYLFMGISETLCGLDVPVRQITSSLYQKEIE
jgi:chemotaxis protein methyltransferase CheR